jgi:hypothetical protein
MDTDPPEPPDPDEVLPMDLPFAVAIEDVMEL